MQNPKIKFEIQKSKIRDTVYKIVRQIPKGKVMTYGQIADAIWKLQITRVYQNSSGQANFPGQKQIFYRVGKSQKRKINPRYVGFLLHNNPDPDRIPCHRVVNSRGKLAKNYAFGGIKGQRKRLLDEGVIFKNRTGVSSNSFFV